MLHFVIDIFYQILQYKTGRYLLLQYSIAQNSIKYLYIFANKNRKKVEWEHERIK